MLVLPQAAPFIGLLLLLGGLFSLSCAVWSWLAAPLSRGEVPLSTTPRVEIDWSPITLVVGLGWIGLDRLSRMATFLRKQFEPVVELPPQELTVDLVRANALLTSLIIGVILLALRWQSPRRSLGDYGITFHRFGQQLATAFVGLLAAVIPVLLVAFATAKFRTPETQHTLFKLLLADPGWSTVLWTAVAAVLLAPLMEELVFRVVLQGWLGTLLSERAALMITAIAFSAVHGWPDMLPLLPLAFVLGVVYQRTHRYFAVVALHALFNAVNLTIALLSDAAQRRW